SGQGQSCELHFLREDSTQVTVDIRSTVIDYGEKKIIQRICRDVTERRKLENQNTYLKQYYEHILNMMPVGLGVKKNVNKNPEIEFENNKLIEMFHGNGLDEKHYHWDYDCNDNKGEKNIFINNNGTYVEEKKFPDGHIYQFTANYYRNHDNTWRELQIVSDITRRRQLEEELIRANDELEQKVEERTRELKEKQIQLAQSEKMAALGNLVAGVAHEINTPLGALKSNNDLFIRSVHKLKKLLQECISKNELKEDSPIGRILDNIEKLNKVNEMATSRIVNIVNSLRKFARLDQAEKDRVDIRDGLESTLTLVHHELKNRIEVIKDYGNIPEIYCYPNQLNQVFMNLLVNASQAIEGKGKITIRLFTKNNNIIVEISDTGRGVSKENLQKIFDPGFTTKSSGVGTGLGLSIVHQIIQTHKGTIEVESKEGQGTNFRLVLPIN
ncbi:MAG: ATP-binding protein, partial [Candidatus Zixiibacteriota bacterium]